MNFVILEFPEKLKTIMKALGEIQGLFVFSY